MNGNGLAKRLHVGLVYWDPFTPGGVQSQIAGRIEHVGSPDGPVRYTLFSGRAVPQPNPWPHLRTEVFGGRGFLSAAVWEYLAALDLKRRLAAVHAADPMDLVDLHAGGAGPAVAAWSRRSRVPYVFVTHSLRFASPNHELRWEMVRYYAWANRRAAAGARKVVAVSAATRQEWDRLGVSRDKIEVQHTAISDQPLRAGLIPTLSPGALKLLFVGRTSRDKGLDLLLDALEDCSRRRDLGVQLTVVGEIDRQHPLRRRAEEARLPVAFLGRIGNDAARNLMAAADLVVIPSRYDPCPVVAIEALHAGALVLAARAGGLPEQVGEHGILVPADDAPALAEAIAQVAAAPDRYRPMRASAREAGLRNLWPRRVPLILDLYRRCARETCQSEARATR